MEAVMGEARNRATRRAEAAQGLEVSPSIINIPKFRQRILDIPAEVDEALRVEYEKFVERTPGVVGFREYLVVLLAAGAIRERQGREAIEAQARKRSVPLPPGMAEASARLDALKEGAA
jgi:hypothetical protein